MLDFIPFIPATTEGINPSIWEAALTSWLTNLTELLNLPNDAFLNEVKNPSLSHFIGEVLKESVDTEGHAVDTNLLRYIFLTYSRLADIVRTAGDNPLLDCQLFCNFLIVFNPSNAQLVRRITKNILEQFDKKEESIISIILNLVDMLKSLPHILVAPVSIDVLNRCYVSIRLLQTLLSATLLVDSIHINFENLDTALIDCYETLTPVLKQTVELDEKAAPYAFLLKRALVSVFNTFADYHFFQPLGYVTSDNDKHQLTKVSTASESVLDYLNTKILDYIEKSGLESTQNAFINGPLIMDWEVDYHITAKLDFINHDAFHGDDERIEFLKLSMEQVRDSNRGTGSWGDSVISEEEEHVEEGTDLETDSDMELMAKISQIHELFPDLGDGFIEACLNACNGDLEAVTMHLIEDTLPASVRGLDRTMERQILPDARTSIQALQHLEHETQAASSILDNDTKSILATRRNIYDNDEFDVFNRRDIDTSRVYAGKKDKGTADTILDSSRLTEEDKKRVIQRVVDIYDDEYDDTYDDINDAGIPVSTESGDGESAVDIVKGRQDTVDPGLQNESLLVHTFVDNPEVFERNSATRKSAGRAELRKRTSMSDEQLEGWAIMFKRNPRKQRILDKYMLFDGKQDQLPEKPIASQRQQGIKSDGRQQGTKGDSKRKPPSETIDRSHKEKNRARFANHNRKAQRDRKVVKAGPPPE